MKKEILMLVIGILIGTIISTGIFLILQGKNGKGMDRDFRGDPSISVDGGTTDDNGRKMRVKPGEDKNVNKQDATNQAAPSTSANSTNENNS